MQERRDSDRLIAGGGKRRRCGEGSRFCRLLEAGPSTVRSSTKAANDRNQEHRRTRDRAHTQAHSIPAHVRPFMHTVKTCMTPHTHSTHTYIYIFWLCVSKRGQSGVSCNGTGKKSRRTLSRKSARPHQIFTQEQLYCRNITHRSCSVIRSIFSAPSPSLCFPTSPGVHPSPPLLHTPLPSPPRAAEMRLGSGPMPLAARVLYMCTEPRSA